MNKSKLLQLALLSSVGLTITACNSGSSSSPTPGPSAQALPSSYICLPSQVPAPPPKSSNNNGLKLAYASQCLAESAAQASNLQELGISLELYVPNSGFASGCTGTPIQYQNGIGFVVTAAHCVANNSGINTYIESNGHNSAWVYQGFTAGPLQTNQLTGQITAVYIPSSWNGDTTAGNDIAVLKIAPQQNQQFKVSPMVKLAPANFTMTSSSTQLMALGYGAINPDGSTPKGIQNEDLYYITYQYFGTNSYGQMSTPTTIMNGWFQNNYYYSIICHGDSGGGDFAWDGSSWNLVGAHSYGTPGCGRGGTIYNYIGGGADVSADVRQFNSWINTVLTQDTQATGCANLGSAYTCASGIGK